MLACSQFPRQNGVAVRAIDLFFDAVAVAGGCGLVANFDDVRREPTSEGGKFLLQLERVVQHRDYCFGVAEQPHERLPAGAKMEAGNVVPQEKCELFGAN